MAKKFDKGKFNEILKSELRFDKDKILDSENFDKISDSFSYIIIILATLFLLGVLIRFIFF